MQFTTRISIPKSNHPIDYDSKVVSLGSCFAVNMAEKLGHFQFRQTVNPFGILFHPIAIEKLIGLAQHGQPFSEADVFFYNERWHSFDAHSDLSDSDKVQLLTKLNSAAALFNESLNNATHIIITYGTAWLYREKTSGNWVANCHKVPQANFTKEILSVPVIEQSIQNTIENIRRLNPNAKIIFTISPVRHIKDGFVENQHSKANLISALQNGLKNQSSEYFPSYEIMMDELRDYRFYAQDMLHPNATAIDYIWQRFSKTHVSESAFAVMDQVDAIRKGLAHRPFNPDSETHKLFVLKLQGNIDALQQQFPHMQF